LINKGRTPELRSRERPEGCSGTSKRRESRSRETHFAIPVDWEIHRGTRCSRPSSWTRRCESRR
jgi:hypothetical protein